MSGVGRVVGEWMGREVGRGGVGGYWDRSVGRILGEYIGKDIG